MRGEELSSQEEELRQNMEELQATQEEAVRREGEMRLAIDAINNTLGTIDLDLNGNIIAVNDMMLSLSHVDESAFVGKRFVDLYATTAAAKEKFEEVWNKLMMGDNCVYEHVTNFQGIEMTFMHSFTPYVNPSGELEKVFDLVVNTTGQKETMAKIAELSAQ